MVSIRSRNRPADRVLEAGERSRTVLFAVALLVALVLALLGAWLALREAPVLSPADSEAR